jgi:hypothetical protein
VKETQRVKSYHLIAVDAARLVSRLPASVIDAMASRLESSNGSNLANLRSQIAVAIPTADHRGAVISFIDH